MKVYILHECIDSSDFYAEDNVIAINKDKEKLAEKMFLLYEDCRDSEGDSVNQDETWCDSCEASVVSWRSGGNYYRHHWKIDKFEV